MRRFAKVMGIVFGVLLVLAAGPAYLAYEELRKARSEDPRVWEADIAELVDDTRGGPAAKGAVVFIGSSSIRLWSTLREDMAPMVVAQHGFGGAKLGDVEYWAEALVNDFAPRAVVVFAGTNDLHPGAMKPPKVLQETYRRFVDRVRAELPDVPIYYIGITPSPMRWSIWDTAQATNALIRDYSEGDGGLHYIETGPALMGSNGQPDGANYLFDGLHLSSEGYAIWTRSSGHGCSSIWGPEDRWRVAVGKSPLHFIPSAIFLIPGFHADTLKLHGPTLESIAGATALADLPRLRSVRDGRW